VVPGEAADKAGIRQGDVVVKVAGQEVTFDNTLSVIVAGQTIGSTVPVEVVRGGRRLTLNVKIGLRPAESVIAGSGSSDDDDSDTPAAPQSDATRSSLGISLTPLTPALRAQLKIPDTVQGVAIAGINPNSDAAQEGLQRGDVILQINQLPTPTPAAAAAAVDAARKAGRDTVLMLVQRGSIPARFIGIKLQPQGAAK
jgi:serine protease Do